MIVVRSQIEKRLADMYPQIPRKDIIEEVRLNRHKNRSCPRRSVKEDDKY